MSAHAERDRPSAVKTANRRKVFELANSTVILQHHGHRTAPLARIEHPDRIEYAGPLPDTTVDALKRVAGGASNGC